MTLARYNGQSAMTYMDYLDLEAGHTLTAEPGQSYHVAPASGRNPGLPRIPGDGKWTPCTPPAPDGPQIIRSPWAETANLPPLPELAPHTGEPPTGPAAPEGEPASPESEE